MMFKSLTRLEELDLSHNQLVSIHQEDFRNLFGLTDLFLGGLTL